MSAHILGPVTLTRTSGQPDRYTLRSATGAILEDRDATAAESVTITHIENSDSLTAKATAALTNNATYQAIASPTTAQAVAQVAALTRQVNALIRVANGLLDDTTGT